MNRNDKITSRQPQKAELLVKYVVRNKNEIDEIQSRFQDFMSRCDVWNTWNEVDAIPAIISMAADGKTLNVVFGDSCKIVVRDLKDVKRFTYLASAISCELPLGKVNVQIGGVDD